MSVFYSKTTQWLSIVKHELDPSPQGLTSCHITSLIFFSPSYPVTASLALVAFLLLLLLLFFQRSCYCLFFEPGLSSFKYVEACSSVTSDIYSFVLFLVRLCLITYSKWAPSLNPLTLCLFNLFVFFLIYVCVHVCMYTHKTPQKTYCLQSLL